MNEENTCVVWQRECYHESAKPSEAPDVPPNHVYSCKHIVVGVIGYVWRLVGSSTTEMAVVARHSTSFDVLAVQFDPVSGRHLAVSGLRGVQVGLLGPCCSLSCGP